MGTRFDKASRCRGVLGVGSCTKSSSIDHVSHGAIPDWLDIRGSVYAFLRSLALLGDGATLFSIAEYLTGKGLLGRCLELSSSSSSIPLRSALSRTSCIYAG